MDEEAKQLIRAFLRRWSTQELTEQTRTILNQDIVQVTAMLTALGVQSDLMQQAKKAPDRQWFAERFTCV